MDAAQTLEVISHPTVLRYFETLNAEAFEAVSQLFAIEGVMHPPFESPIEGRDAIAQYLQKEAQGLKLEPQQESMQPLEDGCTEFQITGKVQTPVFGVNVSWRFIVNPADEIAFVKIKLIASPKELLNLRR